MSAEDYRGGPIPAGACTAMHDITIGAPGEMSKAALVCDLAEGHESLHYDQHDGIWWRSAADEEG